MKIAAVETRQADAGWRMFSFLKVVTDHGIVGWSESNESFGSTLTAFRSLLFSAARSGRESPSTGLISVTIASEARR